MSGLLPGATISPFVAEWLPRVVAELNGRPGPRRALDLAMGEGRHAIPLVEAGFVTYGVDIAVDRLRRARRMLLEHRLHVIQWAADLDTYPLPAEHFDLLFCTRFLLRARWPDLKRSVRPGGFVMYETFTTGQIARGFGPSANSGPSRGSTSSLRPEPAEGRARSRGGPSSPEHLLHPGELARAFGDWTVLHSAEVEDPAALARLVARKPGA
jgi:SAM-dependent methyltransferase